MRIEMRWFSGCPDIDAAAAMVAEAMGYGPADASITRLVEPVAVTGQAGFSNDFTVRADGMRRQTGWACAQVCKRRCRIHFTDAGETGVTPGGWLLMATDGHLN